MRIFFLLIFCCFPLLAGCPTAEQPSYWLVQTVKVKANMTTQYEANVKALITQLQTQTKSYSTFNWFAFVSPDLSTYTYVTPVMDFEHLQQIYQTMADQSQSFMKLHQMISSEVISWDVAFQMPMAHLSYFPQKSMQNIQPYNIIENIEVMPGQQQSFEQALMQWVESSKSNNSASGWSVFVTLIGPNQPQYSIVYNGGSLSSFKAQFSEMAQTGAQNKNFGVLRGYSWTANTYAPELSNVNGPHPRGGVPHE